MPIHNVRIIGKAKLKLKRSKYGRQIEKPLTGEALLTGLL
jgi:hypothetical protein